VPRIVCRQVPVTTCCPPPTCCPTCNVPSCTGCGH
jgi:hypothetical protein